MSLVFVLWFSLSFLSLVAVAVVLIGLVRHVLGLGRTLRRFQEEVVPVAREVSDGGARASARAARRTAPRSRGRTVRERR